MEFKDRLKQYRLDNNLTQDDLAEKLFVSRQAISKYETGRGYPSIDVLTELAKLMSISVDELLTREELVKETQHMTETLRKNKKHTAILAVCIVLVVVLSTVSILIFTSDIITELNMYKVPANHCIVGLSIEFTLFYDSESKLCEPIEQPIKGIDKDRHLRTNFYSVVKGESYTIIVDKFVGWGVGTEGNYYVDSHWEGNVITGFKKTYDEDSGLEDELFWETNYKQINDYVKVTFNENCIVKAVAERYLYVGGVYEIMEKGSNRLESSKIYDYISEYGTICETDGLYYLFIKDEVCVHQDGWKTNLEVSDYKYEYFDGERGKGILAQFNAKQPAVADNEELYLYVLCRTMTGKYFVGSTVYVGAVGFNIPVRTNELELSLE